MILCGTEKWIEGKKYVRPDILYTHKERYWSSARMRSLALN